MRRHVLEALVAAVVLVAVLVLIQAWYPHKAGPAYLYPNRALTPGDVLTTDEQVVCVPYYTKRVRHVTAKTEKEVLAAYGGAPQGKFELDHFISLELGGSNEKKNLWPEPQNPIPGSLQKDIVENYLHREVCIRHRMSLREAQKEIREDWYAVYLRWQNERQRPKH